MFEAVEEGSWLGSMRAVKEVSFAQCEYSWFVLSLKDMF